MKVFKVFYVAEWSLRSHGCLPRYFSYERISASAHHLIFPYMGILSKYDLSNWPSKA